MSADIPAPLTDADVRSLRARVLLELVAGRYAGIDLVAARAELERRLATVGTAVTARYPLASGAETPEHLTAQARANEKTLAAVTRERSARQAGMVVSHG